MHIVRKHTNSRHTVIAEHITFTLFSSYKLICIHFRWIFFVNGIEILHFSTQQIRVSLTSYAEFSSYLVPSWGEILYGVQTMPHFTKVTGTSAATWECREHDEISLKHGYCILACSTTPMLFTVILVSRSSKKIKKDDLVS